VQETTSSSKEQEEEAAKISLPVLCQEDGKTVLRFSELFGVREPYWVIGHRKGRQKRGHTKGQSCLRCFFLAAK
jgi:transcription initiation factor TFIID subunit 1